MYLPKTKEMTVNGKGLRSQIHLAYETSLLVVFLILPFTYSLIYSSPNRLLVTANYVSDPNSATKESKNKSDSHCPMKLSLVRDQDVSLQTQFLTSSHKGLQCFLCWLLYFLNIFMARCPCYQRNVPWSQIPVSWHVCAQVTCTHIHTCKKMYFSTTLLN